uniref:Cation/H+ exchanger, cation/H+ exchanger, CPA1 family n=1 Tax=Tanacetum cinerariifolium TaxID=118510 RepID=A0A6L2KJL2_TANCI|nr:cation/H+ exchanger, cation/H+ exchanger, CPA1 family [Tanacetum cinerariifolium]
MVVNARIKRASIDSSWLRLIDAVSTVVEKVKQEEKQYGFHVSPLEATAGHVKGVLEANFIEPMSTKEELEDEEQLSKAQLAKKFLQIYFQDQQVKLCIKSPSSPVILLSWAAYDISIHLNFFLLPSRRKKTRVGLLVRVNKRTELGSPGGADRQHSRIDSGSPSFKIKTYKKDNKTTQTITRRGYCCIKDRGDFAHFVIQVDILVKDKDVLIKFLLLGSDPCTSRVYLFKLDITSVKPEDMEKFKEVDMSCKSWHDLEDFSDVLASMYLWEQLFDLKDGIFFVDLTRDNLTCYIPGIVSEPGGYIHIRDRMDNILYSYHVKEDTISPSLVLPTSNVSVWECRFEDDHGGAKCTPDSKQEKSQIVVRKESDNEIGLNEWNLLNLPFDILELIMEHCGSVEYLNFRATCKRCEAAAPLIQQSNKTSLMRLQTHSFVSPWLMVVDINQGIITFTDPMLGDNYFMKNLHVSIPHQKILCSRFGWLFFFSFDLQLFVFYNPFTRDLRKLPDPGYAFDAACFSAPPISPDCMVAGFDSIGDERLVLIHYVARESSWRTIRVGAELDSIRFLTFFGQDLYALDGDAKTQEMENKICFPILQSKKRKMVLYSLETCTYHTYNGENIQQKDFFGTAYHLSPHVWIEPSWAGFGSNVRVMVGIIVRISVVVGASAVATDGGEDDGVYSCDRCRFVFLR